MVNSIAWMGDCVNPYLYLWGKVILSRCPGRRVVDKAGQEVFSFTLLSLSDAVVAILALHLDVQDCALWLA